MTARAPLQSRFIYLLYFWLRLAGLPLLVLYFLYRGYRDGGYFRHFAERTGSLPTSFKRTPPGAIWLHAVSVGEVISGIRLIEELRRRNPSLPLYLSTTTLAGRAVAEQKAASLVAGIFYAPIDYGFAVRRVFRAIRPSVLVVLETEIWPVLYRETKRSHSVLLVMNGRISDRALPRYRRFHWVFKPALELPDAILAQTETDRQRFVEIGAPAAKVLVFGNLKYDAAPSGSEPPRTVRALLDSLRPAAVWVAASTMPGVDAGDIDEDDVVIAACRELNHRNPGLLTMIVPRRPERFDLVAGKLAEAGIPFVRRSRDEIPPDLKLPCVLLLDSMGELSSLFPICDVVFMGGTFPRRGGHNVLEPAICAKPIVVGPHMENFAAIASEFRAERAWVEIAQPEQLAAAVEQLLHDPARRYELGQRAAGLARKNSGVAGRAAREILKQQDEAMPPVSRPYWIWSLGARINQRRNLGQVRSLDRPVISAGGLSMGGTGKTPFVAMLAERLRELGLQPAILTRGYRRQSLDEKLLIEAGAQLPTWYTGDEAQILVRRGMAHVGIGADRWSTGTELLRCCATDVFILDDGFQHRRLRRDLDIVLIDALAPFPAGRMREPVTALQRAGLIVITRTQPGRQYQGLRRVLRAANPRAPILMASVAPVRWVPERPREQRVAAFCGLGNPATFWQTLRDQGFDPVFNWAFGDHHKYQTLELRRLAHQAKEAGAAALLTSEKDAVNLPENAAELVAPLQIYWLEIATVVQEEGELLRSIAEMIKDRK